MWGRGEARRVRRLPGPRHGAHGRPLAALAPGVAAGRVPLKGRPDPVPARGEGPPGGGARGGPCRHADCGAERPAGRAHGLAAGAPGPPPRGTPGTCAAPRAGRRQGRGRVRLGPRQRASRPGAPARRHAS
eukprot:2202566-Lingulodinium_polyedra.AAC.1